MRNRKFWAEPVVRNQPEPKPEPILRNNLTLTELMLYGAACVKVGEYAGMAMATKEKGLQAQRWKAYYKALEVKEARYKSLLR
jgi:hypothetical protein